MSRNLNLDFWQGLLADCLADADEAKQFGLTAWHDALVKRGRALRLILERKEREDENLRRYREICN